MIYLYQHKYDNSAVKQMVDKREDLSVALNKEIIQKDINRFNEELSKTKNEFNKRNLENILKYLNRLLKGLNETSRFEFCWELKNKDYVPTTYPIKFICEDLYGLNIGNYVELGSGSKFVDINLRDLADIIAFEIMFKDLGETHESIEELLSQCGMTSFESSAILTDFFDSGSGYLNIYECSHTLKIEDSPYKIIDKNKIQDYFGYKTFKANTYRDVVTFSCSYASTVIANNILKECGKLGCRVRLLSVNPTRVQFIVNGCANEVIRDRLIGDIVVRSFGRKFKLESKVDIL